MSALPPDSSMKNMHVPMSRWRAALIHLALTVLVFGTLFLVLMKLWFPSPYFEAAGGKRLLLIQIGVGLTLGPLLTLLVFRLGKPGLKLDLAVVGLLQVLALSYGIYVMALARPVFVVAAVDRFVVVTAGQLDEVDLLAASQPQWRRLPWTGPQLVGTRRPDDGDARSNLLFSALAGKDIELFPRYYVPYDEASKALAERAQILDVLRRMHPSQTKLIDAFMQQQGRSQINLVWVPLVAHESDQVMVLDRISGELQGILALDPWPPDSLLPVPAAAPAEATH